MDWIIGFSTITLTIAFLTLIYFNKVQSIRSNAPSFLVTLGILFMFMGVGLGLYDFDLSSNPTKAINNLLIHIQGAFIASTIGVFYSILSLYTTNFTEPLSYQDSAFLKLPKFP